MKAKNWVEWCLVGLLATGSSWIAAGCEDGDDDDDASPATAITVTNTVGEVTVTNTVVVTDEPTIDSPLVVPTDSPLALRLLAPTLVLPKDGKSWTPPNPFAIYNDVKLIWKAVAGAATYVVEVDGTKYVTDGTSWTMGFKLGSHTWRVWARSASNVDGWPSATFTFTLEGMSI